MLVFINGKLLDDTLATIAVDDRGLLLGDGLFETILAINGRIIFFAQHYERLLQSAQQLLIPLHYSFEELYAICMELLVQNQLANEQAILRVTLTRGRSQRGIALPQTVQPTLIITANLYQRMHLSHVTLSISTIQRNQYSPLSQLKTLNYLESILCKAQAQEKGFDDGILLNTNGVITESSTANLFFIKDTQVYTPSLDCGVLPGIVREQVIELSRVLGISVEQTQLTPDAIPIMDFAFQTNSLIGIVGIRTIDDTHFIADNNPIFQSIVSAYSHILARACDT